MKKTIFPELFTVIEVAEIFKCTPASVRNMIRNKCLDAIKLPGTKDRVQWRVPVGELQKFINPDKETVKERKVEAKLGYSEQLSDRKIKIKTILNEHSKAFEEYVMKVCNKAGCDINYLRGKSRAKKIADLRHILACIGKEEFDLNDGETGRILNRERTTVIHARNKMLGENSLDAFQIKCMNACREVYKEIYGKDFARLQLTE